MVQVTRGSRHTWGSENTASYLEGRLDELVQQALTAGHTDASVDALMTELLEEIREENSEAQIEPSERGEILLTWLRLVHVKTQFARTAKGGYTPLGRAHLVDALRQLLGLPEDESLPELPPLPTDES
jgi:hypothetical protein